MSILQDVTLTHQKLELITRAVTPQQQLLAQAPSLPSVQPSKPALQDVAGMPWELRNVLHLIQELLLISTAAAGVAIALGDSGSMQCVSSTGDAPPVSIPLQLGNTLSGQCVRTGQVVRFQSADMPESYSGLRAALLAPVFLHGSVAGLIGVFSGKADAFENGGPAAIRHAASMLGLSIAKIEEGPTLGSCDDIGWGQPSPETRCVVAPPPTMTDDAATNRWSTMAQSKDHLLGLPCPVCGAYSLSGESVCGVCQM